MALHRRIGLFFIIVVAVSAPLFSDTPMDAKYERAMHRAMGGVDVLADRFTPANAAMNAHVLSRGDINPIQILSLDVDGEIMSLLGLFSAFNDWDAAILSANEGATTFEQAIDQVAAIPASIAGDVDSGLYADLFTMNIGFGKRARLLLGAYGEMHIISSASAVPLLDSDNLSLGEVDLGSDTEALNAAIYSDLGFSLGMGRLFLLGEGGTRFGVGLRGRGFMRKTQDDYGKIFPAIVNDIDDLDLAELVYDQGMGYGVDTYMVFALADPILDTSFGFEWTDMLSNISFDSGSESDTAHMAASVMIYPLTAADSKKWVIGMDIENLFSADADPVYQIGSSYQIGRIFKHLIPKAGIIFGADGPDSVTVTGGLTARMSFFRLSGSMEYSSETGDLEMGATLDLSTDYF